MILCCSGLATNSTFLIWPCHLMMRFSGTKSPREKIGGIESIKPQKQYTRLHKNSAAILRAVHKISVLLHSDFYGQGQSYTN